MAKRSPRTVAIVVMAILASVFVAPRAAAAETAGMHGFVPVLGFAIFDLGRTNKLRKKLAEAERLQAVAESRARAAEQAALRDRAAAEREHAAFLREHAARERERAAFERDRIAHRRDGALYAHQRYAYKRQLAILNAYRRLHSAQRDLIAQLTAPAPRAHRPAKRASKHRANEVIASVQIPRRRHTPVVHPVIKQTAEQPQAPAREPRPAGVPSTRSVGWGKI